jgi:hypothetical protein
VPRVVGPLPVQPPSHQWRHVFLTQLVPGVSPAGATDRHAARSARRTRVLRRRGSLDHAKRRMGPQGTHSRRPDRPRPSCGRPRCDVALR